MSSYLLDLVGRRRVALLTVSSFAISASEAAGMVLLFPLFQMITDPEFYGSVVDGGGPLTQWMRGDHSVGTAAFGAGLVAFYLFRALIHTRLVRFQSKAAAGLTVASSDRTIEAALAARYQLFQMHSAAEIAGLSYSSSSHAALLMQATIGFLNEAIFLGFVLLGLLVMNPALVALLILLGGLAVVFFIRPFSRRAAQMGQRVQQLDTVRHRFVFAMATAIRDIKIMGLEDNFSRRNDEIVSAHADVTSGYAALSVSLRIVIETLMLSSVAAACIWVALSGLDVIDLAPLLGVLALIVARAVPALSRLSMTYNAMRFSWPIVERLKEVQADIARYPQARQPDQVAFPADYVAENLNFGYASTAIVEEVDLTMPAGSVVVIFGPSGSGKSTLLDLITGLQQPSGGEFRLGGERFDPFHSQDFRRHVGYVPQTIALFDATLEFNIALEASPDPGRLHRAITRAHLSGVVSQLRDGIQTHLGAGGQSVSGGQRQRIGIARALYRDPGLLVLDEVTSALDADSKSAVLHDLLELRGSTTLLFVTHDLTYLDDADLIYRMEAGRLSLVQGAAHG